MSAPPIPSNATAPTLALRRVEHGEALQERNPPRFLACLACPPLFILGREAVSIDDGGSALAFPDIAAERQRLAKCQPMLGRETILDHGPPEDQDIDPGILP